MRTNYIEPQEYLENYSEYSEWINKALAYSSGSQGVIDITKGILNGTHQCWTVEDESGCLLNVTITEIIEWEGIKTLHLITTTGHGWDDYKDAHHTIEQFGELVGCKRITFWGRPLWDKKISSLVGTRGQQYEKQYVVYNMNLGDNDEVIT